MTWFSSGNGAAVAKKLVKCFTIDQALFDALQFLSARQQESMSMIVRTALRSHIRQHKIGASRD